MLFLVSSRTRKTLSSDEFEALGKLAQGFYDRLPPGVKLFGNWAAVDHSVTYALLEAESRVSLEAVQAPFAPYVDMECVEVRELNGWESGNPSKVG